MKLLGVLGVVGALALLWPRKAGATALAQPEPDPGVPGIYAPADARAWSIDWTWPMPQASRVSSGFGWRTFQGNPQWHPGVDLAGDLGEPIYAAAAGVVTFAAMQGSNGSAGQLGTGWGNRVAIDHGLGVMTHYNHLMDIAVALGEQVAAGDLVGWCGSTGLSTGPHLHFGMKVDGKDVDPLVYLERES